jgi:hypothetical protein
VEPLATTSWKQAYLSPPRKEGVRSVALVRSCTGAALQPPYMRGVSPPPRFGCWQEGQVTLEIDGWRLQLQVEDSSSTTDTWPGSISGMNLSMVGK